MTKPLFSFSYYRFEVVQLFGIKFRFVFIGLKILIQILAQKLLTKILKLLYLLHYLDVQLIIELKRYAKQYHI